MRKLIAIPALLALLSIVSFGCHKTKTNYHGIRGKLVVNAACAHYVVQVLDGHIDPSKYLDSWTDPATNITYSKVFTVANVCNFGGADLQQGDTFYFDLGAPIPQNCMVCQIFYATPSVSNTVINVQKYR